MRILVDMQGAQTSFSRRRGVGVYTIEMVKGLIRSIDTTDEIFLVLNGSFEESCDELFAEFADLLPVNNIKVWQQYLQSTPEMAGHTIFNDISELVKEWYMSQFLPDVVWSTNLQEGLLDGNVGVGVLRLCKNSLYCSTLHDVTPILFKEEYLKSPTISKWYWQRIKDVENSDIILTVSNFSKKKICELLDVNNEHVHVAENGVNETLFTPLSTSFSEKENYILYVGGADKHKNLERLILAYQKLPKELKDKYYLYFAGNGIREKIGSFAKKHNVDPIYIENAPNEKIADLMKKCSLFVLPSYAEGFGLPVVEAMSSGAPTITSNQTSLPELACDLEATFDPFDVEDISNVMTKVLSNEDFANDLIRKGLLKVRQYSWNKSAAKILEIFRTYSANNTLKPERCSLEELIKRIKELDSFDVVDKFALSQEIADNIIDGATKRIFVDLSAVAKKDDATGIQRVARAIASVLMKKHQEYNFEVIPVCSDINYNNYYTVEFNGVNFKAPSPENREAKFVDFSEGDTLLLLDLHPANAITKENYLQNLMMRNVNVLFVVYDLIPVLFDSNFFPKGLQDEFVEWLRVVAKSNGVICISQDVSNKLSDYINEHNLVTRPGFYNSYFHLGADINQSVPSKGLPDNYLEILDTLSKKVSILMVSTIEPRKMHSQALDAMEELWNKGYDVNLVFVGKIGWNIESFAKRIRNHNELGKHFFFLERISDEYLEKVYEASSVVLMASIAEGFGLSIIEGAMHNKPLILRDIPVFKEIAKDGAFYFTGKSGNDLAMALERWINLYNNGNYPKSDSIKIMTWEDSADMLVNRLKEYEESRSRPLLVQSKS